MRIINTIIIAIVIPLVTLGAVRQVHAASDETGFIVVAPDRGFQGNEETRAAFAGLEKQYRSELVFVTDERGKDYFRAASERLAESGATRAIVLPLYLSGAHPDFALLDAYYGESVLPVETGRRFGRSAMAPLVLADRLRNTAGDSILIVGAGAETAAQAEAMQGDLDKLVDAVRMEFPSRELRSVVWPHDEGYETLQSGLDDLAGDTHIVPFHLGQKLDSMMAYSAYLDYYAPDEVAVSEGEVTPHPAVTAWMLREASRATEISARNIDRDIGVVVHAHGSDFHWNEAMRAAAAPLADDYLVEYAFSMGDPPSLERAVKKLEARGARAVVIVRVFGLEKSFLSGIERFIGTDYEQCKPAATHGAHGHGHGSASPARLLVNVPVTTTGGLEDHDLFAEALLDRAQALSRQSEKETVILVAHGVGSDAGNDYWIGLLESLRGKMLDRGGDRFRDIHVATWREDWPDKREAAVGQVREFIMQANEEGGRALLIPARTIAEGPARELLPDLDFALGSGFAPHPLFVEWLREQVRAGIRQLSVTTDCSTTSMTHEH